MKVLYLIDALWVGGTERSLAGMLPHLRQAGVEPLVACLRHREEGVEAEVRAAGFEIVLLDGPGLLRQARSLHALVARERPHVVHAALYRSNLVSRLARLRGLNTLLVNSLVSTPYHRARRRDPAVITWKLRLVQLADAVTGRLFVDHFHAVSEAAGEAAARQLRVPRDRISVVVRGRDPERLGGPSEERRRRVRRHLGIAEAVPVIVNTGRQEYPKAHDVLLEALALPAVRRHRPTTLVCGRAGVATPDLERLKDRLGLADSVRFLGHRDDVPDILAAADVFAFPSRYEGFPGAVLEAMGCGLPIVASDIPPVREIFAAGAAGTLVSPDDPAALAAALMETLASPATARDQGLRNRRVFLNRLTTEHSAVGLVALYRRLLRWDAAVPAHRSGR